MKKFLALAVLMGIAVLPAFAQQEIRSEGSLDFSKADLSGNLTVKMIRSDTARIAIKLQDAEINRLNWGVKDGLLTVRLKPGMNGKGSADVTLYYDSLSSVKVSGANVSVAGVLSAVMLDIDRSAGATFGAELATKDTYMKVAGNSVANVTGTTKYFTLVTGAKSKVDCRSLTAEDVRVEAGSAAEVYVNVTERLQMTADTGAAIFYKGSPEILRSSSKMLGTINNIGQ